MWFTNWIFNCFKINEYFQPSLGLFSWMKYIFFPLVIVHWSWGTRFLGDWTCAVTLLGCCSTAERSERLTVRLTIASTQTCPHTDTHMQKHINSHITSWQAAYTSQQNPSKEINEQSGVQHSSHHLLSFFQAYTLPLYMTDTICSQRRIKLHCGPVEDLKTSPVFLLSWAVRILVNLFKGWQKCGFDKYS